MGPANSLELFNQSIPKTSKTGRQVRYAYDGEKVHQFRGDRGIYHWAGTKGKSDISQVPIEVRNALGVNIRKLK